MTDEGADHGNRSIHAFSGAFAFSLGVALPFFAATCISAGMSKNSAAIIEQFSRGRIAVRERSRAFTSLLLLGLTRGCRVL